MYPETPPTENAYEPFPFVNCTVELLDERVDPARVTDHGVPFVNPASENVTEYCPGAGPGPPPALPRWNPGITFANPRPRTTATTITTAAIPAYRPPRLGRGDSDEEAVAGYGFVDPGGGVDPGEPGGGTPVDPDTLSRTGVLPKITSLWPSGVRHGGPDPLFRATPPLVRRVLRLLGTLCARLWGSTRFSVSAAPCSKRTCFPARSLARAHRTPVAAGAHRNSLADGYWGGRPRSREIVWGDCACPSLGRSLRQQDWGRLRHLFSSGGDARLTVGFGLSSRSLRSWWGAGRQTPQGPGP